MDTEGQQVDRMRERITDEIFMALGARRDGMARRLLGRLFYLPTQRFAEIFSAADEAAEREGLSSACRVVVEKLQVRVQAHGLENLPAEGPLLVVSNHPGAYDSVAIGSRIARRDLRILVYETSFYQALPTIGGKLIQAPDDPPGRMLALRTAVQHLQSGGSLLQFGSGLIEPDPASLPGAEEALELWSPSVEIMLRKAPQTNVVLAMASGVLLPRYARHPLTRLRREPMAQRRLAEFMQIIRQLTAPSAVPAAACLSFAPPVTAAELADESGGARLFPALIARARCLLNEHRARWKTEY